jgi:hypothetical protein
VFSPELFTIGSPFSALKKKQAQLWPCLSNLQIPRLGARDDNIEEIVIGTLRLRSGQAFESRALPESAPKNKKRGCEAALFLTF